MKFPGLWVKMSWFLVGCLLGFVVFSVSPALAGKVTNYSADQVHLDEKGAVKDTGQLYVTGDKFRMDGPGPGGGGKMIVIVRKDLGVYRMLNPEKKVYFERPLNEDDMASFAKEFKPVEEVQLGTEDVSGYECQKKRITTSIEIMGYKQTAQSTVWVSDKFDMPLRSQSSNGNTTELRNIKEEKPADELFETPNGYQKVANMMEMFDAPSDQGAAQAGRRGNQQGQPPAVSEELLKKLPKGFKLPSGGQ